MMNGDSSLGPSGTSIKNIIPKKGPIKLTKASIKGVDNDNSMIFKSGTGFST